jgi:hypothetical protein
VQQTLASAKTETCHEDHRHRDFPRRGVRGNGDLLASDASHYVSGQIIYADGDLVL